MHLSGFSTAVSELASRRIIGSYTAGAPGPLVIAMGGIHGNEPSGVIAIDAVIRKLSDGGAPLTGTVLGLVGNQRGLLAGSRYIDEDLNRCFRDERLHEADSGNKATSEQRELLEITELIAERTQGFEDVCFVDCHTTSSVTVPYISVNAHAPSLRLMRNFPLHSVIGLEQSIPGCFGEYCNKLDYRGFTVEAGQHDEYASIENHEAILWLLLVYCGLLRMEDIEGFDHCQQTLARHTVDGVRRFRLAAHYRISPGEQFVMRAGFVNFHPIRKHEVLADNRFGSIVSPCDGRILMPLYQQQGNDGFFILQGED